MYWLDWIFVAILGISIWSGLRKGLMGFLFDFAALLIGYLLAVKFAPEFAQNLVRFFLLKSENLAYALGYILVFAGGYILISVCGKHIMNQFKAGSVRMLNWTIGGLLGLLRGLLIMLPLILPIVYLQLPVIKDSLILRGADRVLFPLIQDIDLKTVEQLMPRKLAIDKKIKEAKIEQSKEMLKNLQGSASPQEIFNNLPEGTSLEEIVKRDPELQKMADHMRKR